MTYMDNPPLPRPDTRLSRQADGPHPDPEMATVQQVVAEFPNYDAGQVLAEVRQRGINVHWEFVCAVMEVD